MIMANISAVDIKQLREKTGAGMMDCKKALVENNGDIEEAIDWLRKKGIASAAKKASRVAAEGLVAVAKNADRAVIVEVNSETDFVAKNDTFQQLVLDVAQVALENNSSDIEHVKKMPYAQSQVTVADKIHDLVGVIGENIQLRRMATLSGQVLVSYIHNKVSDSLGKIAVLVALSTEGDKKKAAEFGKKVAMHVAAIKPESLNVEQLDPALIERERQVLTEQARASGKPDNVIEKMIEGRIKKFYSEVVLLEQPFVMDGKTAVKDALQEAEKDIGGATQITGYTYLVLGSGVEKKEEDFASEVAKAARS